ncbi:MAG: CehA/McbA family metallohydrolase [Burkholderiaceae bacterium]
MIDVFASPGRFYRGNLHTHSDRSDGRHPPSEVCARYRDAGYDFIALTDHFLPVFGFPVTDTSLFREAGFTTLLGAEVHAPSTALGETWHLLAIGLPSDFAPLGDDEDAPALARRCAAAGAYLGIVHPAWYGLTAEDADTIDCAHAVEVYNHTSALKNDRGDGTVLLDQLLARGRRLDAFATDDAHLHIDDSFGAWVMVKAESLTPAALLEALKAGRHYSTQGPQIHAIRCDAESITVECSPASAVIALGRGARHGFVHGDALCHAQIDVAPFRAGGYFRIVVRDADGRRAWSNPVWLDHGALRPQARTISIVR